MPLLVDPAAIAALKQSIDLAGLVRARGVELRRQGRQLVGRCPFHSPDKTPSFFVDPGRGLWKCLGACAAGGDAIKFVMQADGLTFPEAFEKLGGRLDTWPLPALRSKRPRGNGNGNGGEDAARPMPTPGSLLGRVADFYHQRFLSTREGPAYLASRGITNADLYTAFRIGYADGSLPEKAKGALRVELEAGGVLSASGQELLRGCVVFPLVDAAGAVVDLYGRAVARDAHLFLPGPRRGLFGVNGATAIPELVVTESVIDALSFLEAGIPHVLPLYGVNGFTAGHAAWIERATPARVLLALDTDDAGRKGAAALADRLAAPGREVLIVDLPAKDPNALLVEIGREAFAETWRSLTRATSPALSLSNGPPPLARPSAPEERAKEESRMSSSGVEIDGGELRFASGPRLYAVRGALDGSKTETSLRVRIKLTAGESRIIDAVDLYSSRSRNAFLAHAAASNLGARDEIERDLVRLAETIESVRAERAARPAPVSLEMSATDRAEALEFLRSPELLARLAADMTALGYVGEETNKQIGYLVAVSRKLPEPLSMIVTSASGSGKSALADTLEQLTPPEDVILFSRLTPQALFYMERNALQRKLILIEERAGSADADYSIRTLQSKRKLTLALPIKDPTTGRMRTEVVEVLGPAAFLETTTESALNPENASRCFEAVCDESEEQTRRIHDAQKLSKTSAGRKLLAAREAILRRHHNAQRLLETTRVEIPFAPLLSFPSSWLRTRRDHLRFLNLIEAVAFLHQHQRPKKTDPSGLVWIEATADDYERAWGLAAELLGETLSDVKRGALAFYADLRALSERRAGENRQRPEEVVLTRREIREATGLPDHRVRAMLATLADLEYVEVLAGNQGRTYRYRISSTPPKRETHVLAGLLTPEELRERLATPPDRPQL